MWYYFFYLNFYSFIEVGTTRPETVFADVALAVHPEDDRYQRREMVDIYAIYCVFSFIGERARHPILSDIFLPIVADSAVIRDKGTGIF